MKALPEPLQKLVDAAEEVCKSLEHPAESVNALQMWKLRDALTAVSTLPDVTGEAVAWIGTHIMTPNECVLFKHEQEALDWRNQYKDGVAEIKSLYAAPQPPQADVARDAAFWLKALADNKRIEYQLMGGWVPATSHQVAIIASRGDTAHLRIVDAAIAAQEVSK
jgi:hypothetical protein